jgi:hypothetical protein
VHTIVTSHGDNALGSRNQLVTTARYNILTSWSQRYRKGKALT